MPSVTMKQVALHAGCSVMTVSRCLRGDLNHNPETRARILETARHLGYRPNPYLSALVENRRQGEQHGATLALVNPSGDSLLFRNSGRDVEFLKGVQFKAESMGYHLNVFNSSPQKMEGPGLLRILQARGIRGIIFHIFHEVDAHLDLNLEEFAVVSVGYSLVKPSLNRIVPDLYENTLLALRTLSNAGYKRVGLLERKTTDQRSGGRFRAAFSVAYEDKLIRKVPHLILGETTRNEIPGLINTWVKKQKLDAVISSEGTLLRYIKGKSNYFPARVSLNLAPGDKDLPGIDQNWRRIGEKTVDVLAAHLMRNDYGLPQVRSEMVVPGHWSPLHPLPLFLGKKAGQRP